MNPGQARPSPKCFKIHENSSEVLKIQSNPKENHQNPPEETQKTQNPLAGSVFRTHFGTFSLKKVAPKPPTNPNFRRLRRQKFISSAPTAPKITQKRVPSDIGNQQLFHFFQLWNNTPLKKISSRIATGAPRILLGAPRILIWAPSTHMWAPRIRPFRLQGTSFCAPRIVFLCSEDPQWGGGLLPQGKQYQKETN